MSGLSEAEFALFEDGVRQDLSFFTPDALPLSVSLLLDCSASMEQKIRTAQEAGVRFVRALRPQDEARDNDPIHELPPAAHVASARERAGGRYNRGTFSP